MPVTTFQQAPRHPQKDQHAMASTTVLADVQGPNMLRVNQSQSTQQTTPAIEHWVAQLRQTPSNMLNSAAGVLVSLKKVVRMLNLTCVSEHAHYFGPGVSALAILAESHFSIHTWPEYGYAHLDVVICKASLQRDPMIQALKACFAPQVVHLTQLRY